MPDQSPVTVLSAMSLHGRVRVWLDPPSCAVALLFFTLLSSSSAQITVRIAIPGNAESTLRVYQGQSVLIQSVAVNIPEGITVLSYQWTFMSQAVSHLSLQGSRNASLSISNLSYLEHLGDYQCTMTLSTGEQYNSNIISLTAKFAAIFPAEKSVLVLVNDTARLECRVIVPATDATALIAWSRVIGDSTVRLSPHAPGNTVLMIEHAQESDAGEYICDVITDSSGQHVDDIDLTVVTKPSFRSPTIVDHPRLLVGANYSVLCGPIQSQAAVNFTWYLNGRPLETNNRLYVENQGDHESSIVHLLNVSYAEAGTYRCTVSNIAGTVQKFQNIEIEGPPQITYPQRHSVISLPVSMETALLGCRHIAHPNGTVVWTREGKALLLDAGKHRIFENGSLNILNMMPGDSGHYNCTISNMFGADSVTYTLLVIDRPKPPHTLESSFLQDSLQSMVLRWMVAPKELSRPVLTQRLLLHHQGDVLQQFELPANSTSYELEELLPGENYTVTLQTRNDAGFSDESSLDFMQPVSAPLLIFGVFPDEDGHSLQTRWELKYDGGPAISKFNIKVYSVENGSQLLVNSVNPEVSLGSALLTDLEPTTDYSLEVCISNGIEKAITWFSTTTSMAPPSRPSTPKITLTTTHIFKMAFTVRDGSLAITHFLLNTTADGSSPTTQRLIDIGDALQVDSVVALSGGQKQVVLRVGGLQQLTHYAFQVAALSPVGQGEFSEHSNLTALEDGRILYYIIFSVVGGAIVILLVTIAIAVVMLHTSRRIQRTKRTISINGSARIAESFLTHNAERRSSNHSLQISVLSGPHGYTSPVPDTPMSSGSSADCKHHMLSSSSNGHPPLYDRLSDYHKGSVPRDYEKRTGSISSDGRPGALSADMYASDGRIDSVVVVRNFTHNYGASAQDKLMFSSAGKMPSAHSLLPQHQLSVLDPQHLPTSLRQLPTTQKKSDQHLLCLPNAMMTGSSPAIYRCSYDSILDQPTSYMTDV